MVTETVRLRRKKAGLCRDCGSPHRPLEHGQLCKLCYGKNQIRSARFKDKHPKRLPRISEYEVQNLADTLQQLHTTKSTDFLAGAKWALSELISLHCSGDY